MTRKKDGDKKIQARNIREVSGEVNIAAGDIYKGFTAEQVSMLLNQITSDQPSQQLIEPPYRRPRRILAAVVILVVIIGLLASIFAQPSTNTQEQPATNMTTGAQPAANAQDRPDANIARGLLVGQIIISFFAVLGSIAEFTGVNVRDLLGMRAAKTTVEEFPFYVFQDYDKLLEYLFPNPKNPILPDRNITYLRQISAETDSAFQQKGMVLIRGKSKTGKTREACELLRRWWYSGPTVLVARSHVGLFPPFKIPENLPVRNLVVFFDDLDRYLGDNAGPKRLDETLQFLQSICHNRGELRVIATARQEEEFWEKLNFDEVQSPWHKFELIQLNPLSAEKAEKVITELSQMSEIAIEPSLAKTMAEKNDGTFLNLALAFRGWLSQNIKTLTREDTKMFEGALRITWQRRYEELAAAHSEVKPVYMAIDFLQSHDLPLRPALIKELATEIGMNKALCSILGMFDRLQNWIEISPIFNWYRDSQRRRNGWYIISIAGLVLFYLWIYALLLFAPGDMQLSTGFQFLLSLPIWIPISYGLFYLLLNFLRTAKFRKINKALDLLLTAEVPTRGDELQPYENQFEGNGSTSNWSIQNYSGEIREQKFVKYVSVRLMNRYLSLSENLRLKGEFSASRQFASLALKLSPNHPAPLFMLGKIEVDEGNFHNAIRLLKASEDLYHRSSNASYIQFWQANANLLLGEFVEAEEAAKGVIKEMPSLSVARWVLALAQLKQGKILDGQRNCRNAALSNQSISTWILNELVSMGVTQEDWFKQLSASQKIPKWKEIVGKGLRLLPSLTSILIGLILVAASFVLQSGDATSSLYFNNTLSNIFPGSPLLIVNRGDAYFKLTEYEKAIVDYTEAIRIDPKFTSAYYKRAFIYRVLDENKKAIADYTEVIRIDPEDASAYDVRGYAYSALGENEKAIADYTEAIRIDPEYGWAYYDRGYAYRVLGENEKAIADFTEVIRIYPEFAGPYFDRGYAYRVLGENEKAIADFTEAIRIDPEFAEAYLNRAFTHNLLGENEKAIADYTEAIRIDPVYAEAYYFRAVAYRALSENEKAIADFTEAIRINPQYIQAYIDRAAAYRALSENEKAIADFTEIIRIDPQYVQAYIDRAATYRTLGENEKAIVDFTEIIRIDPEYTWAYINRAVTYRTLGENEKAIVDFTEAIRINPEYAWAYYGRAVAYRSLGENEKAIADDTEAIRINPEYAWAYYDRALTYHALGEGEKAIADYIEAIHIDPELVKQCKDTLCWSASIQLDPTNAQAYRSRGIAYYYLGEYEKAIADFTEAIRIDPKFHNVYNWRGVAYNKIGEYKKAISDLTEALRLYPTYANAYYERGYAYANLNEYEKAIADYTEAIRIDPKYADAYHARSLAYKAIGNDIEAAADLKIYKELTGQP